jgi:hypothetical protein
MQRNKVGLLDYEKVCCNTRISRIWTFCRKQLCQKTFVRLFYTSIKSFVHQECHSVSILVNPSLILSDKSINQSSHSAGCFEDSQSRDDNALISRIQRFKCPFDINSPLLRQSRALCCRLLSQKRRKIKIIKYAARVSRLIYIQALLSYWALWFAFPRPKVLTLVRQKLFEVGFVANYNSNFPPFL